MRVDGAGVGYLVLAQGVTAARGLDLAQGTKTANVLHVARAMLGVVGLGPRLRLFPATCIAQKTLAWRKEVRKNVLARQ